MISQTDTDAMTETPERQEAVERLKAAWIAGFEASSEGWNGEYPLTDDCNTWAARSAEQYARAALAQMESNDG